MKILMASSKRSWHDLAQLLVRPKKSLRDLVEVLVSRSCGDPGKILSKRSLHEDLADAMC